MTKIELSNLQIGDICIFQKGAYNKGRIGEVVYVEEDTICLKSIDGKPFKKYGGTCRKLELENYRNLKVTK